MAYLNEVALILSSVSFAFLSYKEWKRKNGQRLFLRLVLTFFCTACLLLLAVPVSWKGNQQQGSGDMAVLLTAGYHTDSLTSFLKSLNDAPKIYHADSLHFIDTTISILHIFGNGLHDDELQSVKRKTIIFHPSPEATGISAVSWNQNVSKGDFLNIEGSFSNHEPVHAKLVLRGFNTIMDSVLIQPGSIKYFSLKTIPRHLGKAVYTVVTLSGEDTLSIDPLPVLVKDPAPARILILSHTPDFENRFLKNWLAGKGYSIATRTRISRSKFEKGFYNVSSVQLSYISSAVLDRFDLLIADAAEINELTKQEQINLQAAISDKSLGLLVRSGPVKSPARFYNTAFPIHTYRNLSAEVHLRIPENGIRFSVNKNEEGVGIRYFPGTQPLISDSLANIFLSSTLYGSGKISFSLLPPTYSLVLKGEKDLYEKIWTYIINKTAKQIPGDVSFHTTPVFPVKNQQVELHFRADSVPYPFVEGNNLAVQQNLTIPEQYHSLWWPRNTGWQPEVQLNDRNFDWFVYDTSNWQTVKAAMLKKSMMAYMQEKDKMNLPDNKSYREELQTIPKILLFLIFICSCTLLWIEKKFF